MRTEKPRYHTSSCRLRDIDKHQASKPDYRWRSSIQLNFIKKWNEWSKTESGCDLQKKANHKWWPKKDHSWNKLFMIPWNHWIYLHFFISLWDALVFSYIFTKWSFSHIYFYYSLCVNAGLYPEYPDYSLTQKPSSMSGQKYLDEINSPDVVLFYFYAIPEPGRSLLLLPGPGLMYNVNSTRRLMQSFTCKVLWKCHH